jgi:prepilin-type N-terminal cleavage/methylation domain-containing protein
MRRSSGAQAGFTLVEILIAMSILLLGMTGIFSLFSTALSLQKEATERFDVSIQLSSIIAQVQDDLAHRVSASGGSGTKGLDGQTFPVPGSNQYTYRVTLEPIPDAPDDRGFFCRIEILAKNRGDERVYDMGYRPIVPEPDNDARIRELLGS